MLEKLALKIDADSVFLANMFGILGAYIAISLCEQLRLCAVHKNQPKILSDSNILFIMACSLGGIMAWCMHFVGMSFVQLQGNDGEIINLDFCSVRTILSLLVVIIFMYFGLLIASRDVMFRKTKAEIIELFIDQSKTMSFKQIQNIKNGSTFAYIIATQSLGNIILGGLCSAGGIGIMHYIGKQETAVCRLHNYFLFSNISQE